MTHITSMTARRVWDSRGRPTVEVDSYIDHKLMGRAIAPAGASRGQREAVDLRDGGDHLQGLDVSKAVSHVNDIIAPALIGRDACDQDAIDQIMIELDGTPLKTNLGGNAMVAASLSNLHAAAASQNLPLWQYIAQRYGRQPSIPLPEIQIFGGGAHAGRRVDIQDFMVMVPGAESFDEALEITAKIYYAAGELMKAKGGQLGVADEGGWWPVFDSNEDALETLTRAIEMAGETPGDRVVISLDIAASEFYKDGTYHLALENRALSSSGMIEMLGRWINKYPIASIEDPLAEDDLAGMKAFTAAYGERLQIIGDDYLVTNAKLVEQAAKDNACNAVLIKVNQAGTVSESIKAFNAANQSGLGTIVSARSGETEDVSIVHLAAGLDAAQLKVGSMTRSERMAKWNECLRLQEASGMGHFVGGRAMVNTWWAKKDKS